MLLIALARIELEGSNPAGPVIAIFPVFGVVADTNSLVVWQSSRDDPGIIFVERPFDRAYLYHVVCFLSHEGNGAI
jgi:hypothetical protein